MRIPAMELSTAAACAGSAVFVVLALVAFAMWAGQQFQKIRRLEARRRELDEQIAKFRTYDKNAWALRALGIAHVANPSLEDVRRAFKRRVREVHPDVGGSRDDFERVVAAREHMLRRAGR